MAGFAPQERKRILGFLSEEPPLRGVAQHCAGGALRLVARNSGKMTYHGTNTYLIQDDGGYWLLDPGPTDDPTHVEDVLRTAEGRVLGYVLTHCHNDHFGALRAMRAAVPAPLYGFHRPNNVADAPQPDIGLHDGDRIGPLTAVHTPGHAPDHLCFGWKDGILFTGDHVMGWSSSVVSPPNGSMADYVASLERLLARPDQIYLPGHGPTLPDPAPYVTELRRRRVDRELQILTAIRERPMTPATLSQTLYAKLDPVLQFAAERNVISHLVKLQAEGKATQIEADWVAVA